MSQGMGEERPQGEEAGEGLLTALRERAISLATMPRHLRLLTGLAIAQLIVAAVCVAVRDSGIPWPSTPVAVIDGGLVTIPVPLLVLTLVMLAVAWAYLLAGVLHAWWPIRLGGVALFTWLISRDRDVYNFDRAHAAVALALLGAVWLVAAASLVYDYAVAPRRGVARQRSALLVVVTIVGLTLLVAGMYADAFLSERVSGVQLLFTGALTEQLSSLSVFLIPLLFLAGVDFADWAEITGDRIAGVAERLRTPWVVGGLLLAAAAGTAGWQAWRFRHDLGLLGQDLAWGVGALALVVAVVMLMRRRTAAFGHRVPYLAMAAMAVVGFSVQWLAIYVPASARTQARIAQQGGRLETTLSPLVHREEPQFSMLRPNAWEVQANGSPQSPSVLIDGIPIGNPAAMIVYSLPAVQFPDATSAVTAVVTVQTWSNGFFRGQVPYLSAGTDTQGWARYDIHSVASTGHTPYRGRIWSRHDGDRTWVLLAFSGQRIWDYDATAFDHMAESWRPAGAAPATEASAPAESPLDAQASVDRGLALEMLSFAGLTLAALVGLWILRRTRWAPALATAAVFGTVVTLLGAVAVPANIIRYISGGSHDSLVGFHLEGVQMLVGVAALALVAVAAARRRLTRSLSGTLGLVLGLVLALQIVSWIYSLYDSAQSVGGRFSAAQGAIILLALAWDVTMSGEAMTNGDSHWLPRHSRVLLFFGYVTLVAIAVMYFSSFHAQAGGEALEPQFETEGWPQGGLVILGVPVLLSGFVVRLLARRRPAAGPGAGAA